MFNHALVPATLVTFRSNVQGSVNGRSLVQPSTASTDTAMMLHFFIRFDNYNSEATCMIKRTAPME